MKLIKALSVITVATALAGGLPAYNALADLPQKPLDVKVMDTNKNNRIEKSEYLAFMGAEFDKLAGAKGYCTFKEVSVGLRRMGSAIPDQSTSGD
jgi:hypothetical protein